MKLIAIICVFSILFLQTLKSQDSPATELSKDTVVNPREYSIVVKQINAHNLKGYFASIQDSTLKVTVIPERKRFSFASPGDPYFQKIDYKSIISVKIYEKNKKSSIILGSILAGAVAGAIIGFALGDDKGFLAATAGEKAVFGAIVGIGIGSAIGGIIALSTEKKYLINGELKNLQEMKNSFQNNK